ncbi:MAG: 50S ribosomal protein L4 [Calditrichaeota bacterium]|nr:50S ribosomal protein L4 [Calditrichota bacterium]RQV92350.1 MAG: 50S ribosomal protein L4 [bacterium]RQV98693.1 MAG: 50S ribosomal protein L4 [Calditrichota bacterium]
MELNVYKIDGTKTNQKVELKPEVFEIIPNDHVVYLAVKAYLANQRQGTHSTKGRSEVSGGGKKPFRQKGTGRARQGTIRAAQMVGGGRAHGTSPRDYTQKLSKKMSKLARKSVLSDKARENKVMVLEDFTLDEIKTKKVQDILNNLKLDTTKVLFVTKDIDKNLVLSSRNIPYTKVQRAPEFSVYDIINSQYILFQEGAVQVVNEVLA